MSLLKELSPTKGSKHAPKRIGRGIGSGMGGTATKGHKGQLARAGGKVRRGFEGGQTPLMRRLPKFGFTNVAFANRFEIVNVSDLNKLKGEVTPEILKSKGFVSGKKVKILGHGSLTVALTVKAHKFSETAKTAIEKAGGKAEVIS
ncbi:MAG TPA: 50S ribosomal protein L15 [Pseudobdellovibrionaceae bacterium]|nr:50S ribosomal protein L15 [Pseudobdellovibrionaceae bacterium]